MESATDGEVPLPKVQDLKDDIYDVDLDSQRKTITEGVDEFQTTKIGEGGEIPIKVSDREDVEPRTANAAGDEELKNKKLGISLNPTVEHHSGDSVIQDVFKPEGSQAKDLSSGSSVDSEPDSESTVSEPFVDSSTNSQSGSTKEDKNIRSRKQVRRVYKFDHQFAEFIQDFTSHIDWKRKLVINSDTLFNEELFPIDFTLMEYVPTTVVCTSLKKLEILVPRVLDHLQHSDCKAFFRQVLGDQSTACKKEEMVRDNILFVLQSIKASSLESFTLENVDHGLDFGLDGLDRLSIWEDTLRNFVCKHSPTLKRINIRTVRLVGNDLSSNNDWAKEDQTNGTTFPNLEELSLIFWEKPTDEPSIEEDDSLLETYWVHLLQSRVFYGQLRKLVWMSSKIISWNYILSPVIHSNKGTLETLHIVCVGDQLNSDISAFPKDQTTLSVGLPLVCGPQVILSCAQFVNMINLRSLYLRKPRCFLTRLVLLPPQLEELSLDFIYLESEDLADCLGKLGQLKKLRLVDNIPVWGKKMDDNANYFDQDFGVNEKVLLAILNHRKLADVCIWGYSVDLDIGRKPCLAVLPISSKDTPSKSQKPLMTTFQKFGGFLKNIYCKSKAVKKPTGKEYPKQTLSSLLHQVAVVRKDCIIIDQSDGCGNSSIPIS